MQALFLDCEFTALQLDAKLLSLALVHEAGAAYYAVFEDELEHEQNNFVKRQVIPQLYTIPAGNLEVETCYGSKAEIKRSLTGWLGQWGKCACRVWADVLAYDWVLFCQLFGGANYLPEQLHYIPLDLATLIHTRGYDPDITRAELLRTLGVDTPIGEAHNALTDANWGMQLLKQLETKP